MGIIRKLLLIMIIVFVLAHSSRAFSIQYQSGAINQTKYSALITDINRTVGFGPQTTKIIVRDRPTSQYCGYAYFGGLIEINDYLIRQGKCDAGIVLLHELCHQRIFGDLKQMKRFVVFEQETAAEQCQASLLMYLMRNDNAFVKDWIGGDKGAVRLTKQTSAPSSPRNTPTNNEGGSC